MRASRRTARRDVRTVIVAREPVPELSPELARVLIRILRHAGEARNIQEDRRADPPEALAS